jgi:serine/threonine protein kinase
MGHPMESREESLIGSFIEGIKLIRVIGRGTFSVVLLGQKSLSFEKYAVKCMKKSISTKELLSQMSETQILSKLNHPNIVKLTNTIETDEYVYLIQEYCQTDLFECITYNNGFDGLNARSMFIQLCHAVVYCHSQSVFHRDIKPENILLMNNGATVKLADFGLATNKQLSRESGCGTDAYLSPECYSVSKQRSTRSYSCSASDIWSLGVVLINILSGSNPWRVPSKTDESFLYHMLDSGDLDTFRTSFGFTDELCQLLRRILNLDPFARPTARELLEDFSAIPHLKLGTFSTKASFGKQPLDSSTFCCSLPKSIFVEPNCKSNHLRQSISWSTSIRSEPWSYINHNR